MNDFTQPEAATLSRERESPQMSQFLSGMYLNTNGNSDVEPALLVSKEISSHFLEGPEALLDPSEREEIGDHLISAGLSAMGGRLINCRQPSSELVFVCLDCSNVVIKPSSCNVRGCPRCNGRRFRILEKKFGSGLSRMRAPSFLSLSYPNVSRLERVALDYATMAFARLRRSKCFRSVRGGFYDVGVTFNPSTFTYNVHIHAVIDAPFLNRSSVYARWMQLTSEMGGETRNVHIERAFTVVNGRKVKWHPRLKKHLKLKILEDCSGYLLKHAVKLPALPTSEKTAAFLIACYHKRLVQGFGSMFDLPPAPRRPMICAECEGSSWSFEGYAVVLAAMGERLLDRPFRRSKPYPWDAGG